MTFPSNQDHEQNGIAGLEQAKLLDLIHFGLEQVEFVFMAFPRGGFSWLWTFWKGICGSTFGMVVFMVLSLLEDLSIVNLRELQELVQWISNHNMASQTMMVKMEKRIEWR
ncbi:hypothetical protein ACH5RR_022966 [Cinchona calisaya]|uniref:Uncharacterized protein n=1 Tax=Cinchona calisaya TaxID=153742 RepID=A0ABD2ZAE9_9GENT